MHDLNRTFARRIGKGLSDKKKKILEDVLPQYLFSENQRDQLISSNKVVMEIGFGMGDHFLKQIQASTLSIGATATTNDNKNTPDSDITFLGAEVYINGVAQFLESALDAKLIPQQNAKEEPHRNNPNANILLWPDDVDLLFKTIPDHSIDIIYILFPDPWPKRKQNKKRLLNKQRLETIKLKLKRNLNKKDSSSNTGSLVFATDIEDYFNAVKELVDNDPILEFVDNNFSTPHSNYATTKYHKKAIREGRKAQFMRIICV